MKKLKSVSKKGKNKFQIHEETVAQKYSSIIYMSTKTLRKEAKVVKSFECQKVVRKIKDYKLSESSESQNDDKIKDFEETLKKIKAFDLDLLVQTCISRCGLVHDLYGISTKGDKNINTKNTHDTKRELEFDEFTTKLMKDMIQHKKIASLMQTIRVKVSEFKTWLAKEEEWLAGKKVKDTDAADRGQKRKRNEYSSAANDQFIGSLARGDEMIEDADLNEGADSDDGNDNYGVNHQYGDCSNVQIVKKNRMGQRQRKSKARAIEALNIGKKFQMEQSLNWRPKKEKKEKKEKKDEKQHTDKQKEETASGLDKSKKIKVADVANMGKSWKEEGKAHPSWAARETQKSKYGLGIVEFTGKKITFE